MRLNMNMAGLVWWGGRRGGEILHGWKAQAPMKAPALAKLEGQNLVRGFLDFHIAKLIDKDRPAFGFCRHGIGFQVNGDKQARYIAVTR